MKVSYDSADLITELSQDILEFGNLDVWAISSIMAGQRIYTDYDFILSKKEIAEVLAPDEKYPSPISLHVGEKKEKMKAENLLSILIDQNSLF
ncbi:hypothetical protein [Enterococcus sp. DIV0800]|uniref:hypothetical protein n=1 Tax=unclassified Enterococcus TaxID=2608891 RepID=UPI003D2FFFE0